MTHKTKRERRYAASYKFERIAALNDLQDKGGASAVAARKVKAELSNTWTRRHSHTAGELHRPNRGQGTDAGVALHSQPKGDGRFTRVKG